MPRTGSIWQIEIYWHLVFKASYQGVCFWWGPLCWVGSWWNTIALSSRERMDNPVINIALWKWSPHDPNTSYETPVWAGCTAQWWSLACTDLGSIPSTSKLNQNKCQLSLTSNIASLGIVLPIWGMNSGGTSLRLVLKFPKKIFTTFTLKKERKKSSCIVCFRKLKRTFA